ncbi:hypothetical protein IGI04_008667 [Brassica rapa subsp. trilocularis]|uniref:Uncharacterized protein n=1 Tax=Brassica rapa subsp. trilocularis TaxID=1813537 RepID=A0ABQ7NNJ1_BRACM|nr:hypothetical protein IGI04_008667 [Brassica rapa subsp. trilocularis]
MHGLKSINPINNRVQDLLNATKNIGDLGFVLTFIFRTWLSNQNFSYNGWGMTEEKKVLAKWLKENVLRLGPIFIKNWPAVFYQSGYSSSRICFDQLSELQLQLVLVIVFCGNV